LFDRVQEFNGEREKDRQNSKENGPDPFGSRANDVMLDLLPDSLNPSRLFSLPPTAVNAIDQNVAHGFSSKVYRVPRFLRLWTLITSQRRE
jgi:hypothetical protein